MAQLIRMTLFAPTTPTEREREGAESSAARVVAATFQQRPRINTTDLILEMARKEGREEGGGWNRIRDNLSPSLRGKRSRIV